MKASNIYIQNNKIALISDRIFGENSLKLELHDCPKFSLQCTASPATSQPPRPPPLMNIVGLFLIVKRNFPVKLFLEIVFPCATMQLHPCFICVFFYITVHVDYQMRVKQTSYMGIFLSISSSMKLPSAFP